MASDKQTLLIENKGLKVISQDMKKQQNFFLECAELGKRKPAEITLCCTRENPK